MTQAWVWTSALLVVLLACQGAAAAKLPSCRGFDDWRGAKPCPFKKCYDKGSGAVFDYRHCAICDTIDDGTRMADFLACNVCDKGWVSVGDRYRRECLSERKLQCKRAAGDGCATCRHGTVKISAAWAPATFYRASVGFCANMWTVAPICRTCDQLGCPGRCRDGKGCTSCPRGAVRLATVPPAGLNKKDWHGYCTGLKPKPFEPVPALPAVCLRPGRDLHCADGKFKDGVGCTACPRGWHLGPIKPAFIAGSSFLQLQVAGSACYHRK